MPFTEKMLLERIAKHRSEFLSRARTKHGDKYEYDISKYESAHIKMEIVCRIHGPFLQKPYDHLYGKGCKKCAIAAMAKERTLDTAAFVEKAKAVHGDRYSYTKTSYVNSRSPVTVTCHIHGDFVQNASTHLNTKEGCYKCGSLYRAAQVTNTKEEFVARAKAVHGARYDYTETVYEHCDRPVTIGCKIHGNFLQTPTNHTAGKSGCRKCANEAISLAYSSNTEEFIAKARLKHGDRYDYSTTTYTNHKDPVSIVCRTHGVFEQMPSVHLSGSGCRKCIAAARTYTTEEFIARGKEVHGDRYDYSKTAYIGCYDSVQIICKSHGLFQQQANSHVCGTGCPLCAESRGERDVAFILDKLGVNYVKQYMVPNNLYKYDFYLPEHNVFIEYHGIQHYQRVGYFHREDGSFQAQVIRDDIKRDIVKAHRGTLIVVRYTVKTREQIEELLTPRLRMLGVLT